MEIRVVNTTVQCAANSAVQPFNHFGVYVPTPRTGEVIISAIASNNSGARAIAGFVQDGRIAVSTYDETSVNLRIVYAKI